MDSILNFLNTERRDHRSQYYSTYRRSVSPLRKEYRLQISFSRARDSRPIGGRIHLQPHLLLKQSERCFQNTNKQIKQYKRRSQLSSSTPSVVLRSSTRTTQLTSPPVCGEDCCTTRPSRSAQTWRCRLLMRLELFEKSPRQWEQNQRINLATP